MTSWMRAWCVVLPLLLGAGACSTAASQAHHVERAEAHRLVAEGATLLDVRTPGEYQAGHVEGARNIPVQELAARMSEVPRDHPIVVYCQSGGRSAQATAMLVAAGYDAHDLGGIANW
jgi:phage shock protein E